MINVKSTVLLGFWLAACSSETTNEGIFGEGGSDSGGAGMASGGAAGVAVGGAGGVAGMEDAGVEAMPVCNAIVCDEQISCNNTTCTIAATTRWCRKFNGVYSWIVEAFCGTPEFPFGSTLLECDDAGLRVCCVKTGNWETSC